jgi:LysM repeat protein
MKFQRALITLICLLAITIPIQTVTAQGPCGSSYVVLPGDTISEIALLCEVTVANLLEANPQITNPNRLLTGTTLSIPSPQESPLPRVDISPICGVPGTEILAVLQDFPANSTVEISISRIDQTSNEFETIRTNSQGSQNAVITIPDSAKEKEAWAVVAQAQTGSLRIEESSNLFYVTGPLDTGAATTYFVQSGDTLRSIAAKFNRSISAILAENPGITNPSLIYVGQRLNIPGIQPGQPAVVISPSCGPPGTEVNVLVTDFPINSGIEIGIGKQNSTVNIVNTLSSDSNGSLETGVIIPNDAVPDQNWLVSALTTESPVIKANSNLFSVIQIIGVGVPTIYIVRPGDMLGEIAARFGTSIAALLTANPDLSNRNSISVGERLVIPGLVPTVSITPEIGLPGSQIQIEVSGFPPNTMLDISLRKPISPALGIGTFRTSSNGTLRTEATIPDSAKFNERWEVVVQTTKGAKIDATSNQFTVVRVAQSIQPVITIWPHSGPAGTRLDVVAMGFPRYANIEIGLGRNVSEIETVDTVLTDINGTFHAQVTIPNTAQPNEMWIVLAHTIKNVKIEAASVPFSVSP